MSHDWNCPDRWQAQSEARRDAEDGWNRHRYREDCEEASREYEREYRNEQYRIEERAEEERAQHRYAEQREEQRRMEEQWAQQGYEEQARCHYEARMHEEYVDAMIAQEIEEGRVNRDAECTP